MAKVCEFCGKNKNTGFSISHSHKKSKKVWNANIQKIRVSGKNENARRINVCTKCLKSGKAKRAVV